jgi:hypothetical protein
MATMTNAEFELQRKQREEAERLRLEAAARKNHLLAKSNYTSQAVDPFGNDSNQERIPLKYGLSRDGRQYSEKQLRILRLCGCDPNRYPYRQGQAIISSQIAKWKKQRAA